MDNFKIPPLEKEDKSEYQTLEMAKERRKFFECAQFDCLPRHLGLAVAFKNYWVYRYDFLSASKIL